MKKDILNGYAEFDWGRLTDEEVYSFIKANTRLIDRINPKKMYVFSQWAFTLLQDRKLSQKERVTEFRNMFKTWKPKDKES